MGVCLYVLCFYFSRIEDVCVLVVKFWGRGGSVYFVSMVLWYGTVLWDYGTIVVWQ
jgi:hypothetical protein